MNTDLDTARQVKSVKCTKPTPSSQINSRIDI
jgi:hypothetical protein